MYQHTKIFSKFIFFWNENINFIKNINISFLIPKFPVSTFRDNDLILETVLFDIGCYPISLLVDIGFSEDNLVISNYSFNSNLVKLNITNIERNININISIENQNIRFSKIIKSTTLLEFINRQLSV